MLKTKECEELLMNYLSNSDGWKDKDEYRYRFTHCMYVKELAETIIEKRKDLFKNEKLNKEFLKACILHDIYKLDKNVKNHAHEAGILLMELGFSFEIAAAVMMHSDKHIPKENTKTISKYALLLQDVDIISKYNFQLIRILFKEPKEIITHICDLLCRLENTEFYIEESYDIVKKLADNLMKNFYNEVQYNITDISKSRLNKMKKYLPKQK